MPLTDTIPLHARRLTSRERARLLIERDAVKNGILGLIIFNAIMLGLSTSGTVMDHFGPLIRLVDALTLAVFVVELSVKFYAYGLRFFRSSWNIFDLIVVVLGLLPYGQGAAALRGLRVIRALRLLSAVPQMRAVVQALLDALPGMGAVVIMISIVFYVFSVMATLMYGATFDQWFGTLGRSAYSLFQIMTLEGWSDGIVRPLMLVHPLAWLFFIPFIIITSFSVLNLFIGLLVNTMQSAVENDAGQEFERLRELVKTETDIVDAHVLALAQEISQLRAQISAMAEGKSDAR